MARKIMPDPSQPIVLPFVTSRVLVISDFNCPYCFLLNEWLSAMGKDTNILWVGIEHRPDLPKAGINLDTDSRQISQEVDDVNSRGRGITVQIPELWQNSRSFLLVQNALEIDAPDRATEVRRAIFRQFWNHQEPVSEDWLMGYLGEQGIPIPEQEPDYLDELTRWWKEQLDRVPCMLSPTGLAHLGLQDVKAVGSFVNSAIRAAKVGPGCRL